jgi:hypothetical protein
MQKLSLIRKDKRAVGGLDFLRLFMISLTVVIVLAFALTIMGAQLSNSVTGTDANSNMSKSVIQNFTAAIGSLGNSVGTWITLAGLVVIIGIIAVVISIVMRFGGNAEA